MKTTWFRWDFCEEKAAALIALARVSIEVEDLSDAESYARSALELFRELGRWTSVEALGNAFENSL